MKSLKYALLGLKKIFQEEQNLQIELFIAIMIVALGAYWRISVVEWGFVSIAIFLVLLTETLNSAVERLTDILKPRIHDYVKDIKDIMAASVMLSAVLAIVLGLLVFLNHFIIG